MFNQSGQQVGKQINFLPLTEVYILWATWPHFSSDESDGKDLVAVFDNMKTALRRKELEESAQTDQEGSEVEFEIEPVKISKE